MKREAIDVVKKNKILFRYAKSTYLRLRSLRQSSFLFFDSPGIKNQWYRHIKNLQIDTERPLYADRQCEIQDYFDVSSLFLLKHYIRYGLPWSERFKRNYLHAFEGNTEPEKLKGAYDSIPLDYTLRLMMAYERFSLITDYLDFLVDDSGKELNEFHVLDYGCGVSDIGLLFSSFGAKVTICDLDNTRLDFVVARFHRRGYKPDVIRVIDTELYPKLPPREFDLIIATELFEHVRDPFLLLSNFTVALRQGGYLFDSMGGVFERDDRPHHLKEAITIGKSERYTAFYARSYEHISLGKG